MANLLVPKGMQVYKFRGGPGADARFHALAYLKGQGATCATCRNFKAHERCYEERNGKRGVTREDELCLWHMVKR
jgi:hypothetical protein